jgi:serine phosphatase RsbU (regulator of sigma subunit)
MGDRTLVAFVPVDYVKTEFFDPLNNSMRTGTTVNATLLDSEGNAIISLNPAMVGRNRLAEISDPEAKSNIDRYIEQGQSGSWTVDKTTEVGGMTLPPRIMAAEPVPVLGKRWTVLISSPTSETDAVIRPIFDSAILWAAFFAFCVAALLGSTSFFMIRGRMKYERARHELLSREIEQARRIQLAWLPDLNNVPAGLEISAVNMPASHISGDFYNWFELADGGAGTRKIGEAPPGRSGRVAIVIGDVTGHGMAAAFLMATTQLLVRTTLSQQQDPGRCLEVVNQQLCTQGFGGQFVTMIILIIDRETSSIEVATAGHPAPLLARNGRFAPLEMEPQLVLGVDPDERYHTRTFPMEPGGSLLLYTDGVVEAEQGGGEQYGLERLVAAASLRDGSAMGPRERIEDVVGDLKRFEGNRELQDDVTLVAIRAVEV